MAGLVMSPALLFSSLSSGGVPVSHPLEAGRQETMRRFLVSWFPAQAWPQGGPANFFLKNPRMPFMRGIDFAHACRPPNMHFFPLKPLRSLLAACLALAVSAS